MLLLLAGLAQAGLGPDDVLVLYNADDSEALATAEHYALARDVDAGHLCAITGVDPAARSIDLAGARAVRDQVEACRGALPHPGDIDALVLVRGLPYRVDLPDGGFFVSLEAALQVGRSTRRSDGTELLGLPQARQGNLAYASVENPAYLYGDNRPYNEDMTASFGPNPYYATAPRIARGQGIGFGEGPPGGFERMAPRTGPFYDFTDELLIVSRLDGFDHTDARDLVDRAVLADGSFPTAPFLCMRGAEGARGVRDAECEYALRMLDAAGLDTTWEATHDAALSDREVIAYWTGAANLKDAIAGITYMPGAVADNITSFGAGPSNFFCSEDGATCPASESQTSIARFIRAGASAAHGTSAEPLNNTFPNAGFLLLYAQGYTLGEAWLYNQRFVYWQNVYLGDPLMAPFAERPTVAVADTVPVDGALLDVITVEHPDGIDRVTFYIDGIKPDDASVSLQDLGYVEGDTVEVRVVATAAAPTPLDPDGWPNTAPVTFDPGTKGWAVTTLTAGAPLPVSEPEPEPSGCGCQSAPPAPLPITALLLLALLRRRRQA